jgi:Mg/Co/Ni transporter MgtE
MLNARAREATVVDEDGCLLGIVCAQDLFDVHENTIESIVKPARVVIPATTSSTDAVSIMNKVGCDHAVVVDGEKVVGLFTWEDIAEQSDA